MTYANFAANYPKHKDENFNSAQEIYSSIGGTLLTKYNANPDEMNNTCAARLSIALNKSGITLPNIPNKTFESNGKYYFIVAADMIAWMKKAFGTPSTPGVNYFNSSQSNNFNPSGLLVFGKKGIYAMIPKDRSQETGFGATGHIDLLTPDKLCDGGCFFNATGGVKEAYIWELP